MKNILTMIIIVLLLVALAMTKLVIYRTNQIQRQNDSLTIANENLQNQLWQERIDCHVITERGKNQ